MWSPTLSGMGDASDNGAVTLEWGCYENEINADEDSDGASNTDTILTEDCKTDDDPPTDEIAAKACNQLEWAGSEQGDWYLPAKLEIEALVQSAESDGDGECPDDWTWEEGSDHEDFDNCEPEYDYNAQSAAYWSSTESSSTHAHRLFFSLGSTHTTTKFNSYRVRCVRR